MRLDRLVANLGYGTRREMSKFFKEGRVTLADGTPVRETDRATHAELRFDGEPLDPPAPLTLVMHKPPGYVCSHDDGDGRIIYELLPERYPQRNPVMSTVGRLDKDTSGLLLLTDDGTLLHRLISPKKAVWKTYHATLAEPLRGDEAEIFAAGTLMLDSERKPCLPARLEVISPTEAKLSVTEGRYHQVRRMFAAVGNAVTALRRVQIGALTLEGLDEGEWRVATAGDVDAALGG